ncbi:MAG: undecaprenyl/decaprenyl-phosphate alpha-N-acetylglucosaminyl 1-phosphate transferase [Chloroflexi bacterium]|uniref:MraY family glycosyltransferase n=1 Tax=Candidatus Flexifilum breve TaxID=3140694 RepID=UPI0031367AE7|nr:undecaprenyl/decaprenyl-phosphate alpha-N-acetylglucosaminyl 1-phosphate transferase [Chloroflexota bacterium]
MGGLAIFGGLAIAICFTPPHYMLGSGAFLIGAALLAIVGLIDDRYELGIKAKMIAQVAAGLIVVAAGIHIQLFNFPVLDILLTLFWIVALTNALNFLDNMDGLTSGLSAIAAGWFTLIAFNEGLTLVSAQPQRWQAVPSAFWCTTSARQPSSWAIWGVDGARLHAGDSRHQANSGSSHSA